jgi:2-polyprenyl-6-methoxyphenol hydroxylase-like FAD-dependent oxidoreductase
VNAPGQRFIILGGGTAGWMAACLIAQAWPQHSVTLVESPEIGIIGVGEGSTPQLKLFFDRLGIAEEAWMPACNATFKNGISFHGWSDQPGFASYFHPFPTRADAETNPLFMFHTRARRTGRDVWAHPDRFFLGARLAAEHRAPKQASGEPLGVTYGYHFDATLVGQFLRGHATTNLGVSHLERRVADAVLGAEGQIEALITKDGERIAGDFFIDCSGFRGALLQQKLGERFIPFGENLLNDRAVAMPTPNAPGPLPSETRATALSGGWVWKIPLTNRTGNGYVYSSAYLSPDQAEAELRNHLGPDAAASNARHLTMKVGRVARSWVKNCLAIGLSQGFIEPLEATALHIVQSTVEDFIAAYESEGLAPAGIDAFNATTANRYDGIRDYIVAHYRLAQRSDSDYWRANAANQALSDTLKTFMTDWFTGADLAATIDAAVHHHAYSPMSWHCLMAGYGNFPDAARLRPPEPTLQLANMGGLDAMMRNLASGFPLNRSSA